MNLPWPFRREDPLDALLGRARGGDERALVELYEALYPRVFSFVARRTRSREDAEDAVSRTFHRLLERLAAVETSRGGVAAFALAIARNLLIDDARARRTSLPIEEAGAILVEESTPLGELLRDEELRRLRAALAGLPAETRELVALRYGDGLSHAEIGGLLGLTEVACRQRASRALASLKAALLAGAEEGVVAHGR